MSLFAGELTAIVQTTEKPGKIVFETATSGIRGAVLELRGE
jgi:hypothetical protein